MNSWRDQFELNFSSGATTSTRTASASRRARRIGVVAAGQLDRRPEVEGADLDAGRIERRLVRRRRGGAAAARSGNGSGATSRATAPLRATPIAGRGTASLVGAQRIGVPAIRSGDGGDGSSCAFAFGPALSLRLCPWPSPCACLRLPEESKPVVPAPDAGW